MSNKAQEVTSAVSDALNQKKIVMVSVGGQIDPEVKFDSFRLTVEDGTSIEIFAQKDGELSIDIIKP